MIMGGHKDGLKMIRKYISLWEEKSKLVENHYVVPIPWKDPHEAIPNNFGPAKGRLDFLVKKLQKQNLVSKYEGEIGKLLDKSYAEMFPEVEVFSSRRVWYLPHHRITTVKKPDKLRVVYDCAAKYQGASLNDRCYQGPDLINNLSC